MSEQRIVVGYDGSESSRVALTWALAEASARQAPIVAVHVLDVATGPWASGSARSARTHDELRGEGERLLLAAQHESRREAPDVDLQTKVGSLLLEVAGYDDALRLFRQALAGVYSESSAPTSKCSRTRDLDAVGCLTYVFCLPRSSKPSVFANSC